MRVGLALVCSCRRGVDRNEYRDDACPVAVHNKRHQLNPASNALDEEMYLRSFAGDDRSLGKKSLEKTHLLLRGVRATAVQPEEEVKLA